MAKRKTAGALALQASSDSTKYNSLEVGHALSFDIGDQLRECIENHKNIFDEDEFCVGYVLATDPLIKGVMRRKFFAFLYLPQPRPNQSVWLYNKRLDAITKRLWILPEPFAMAALSEMTSVAPQWRTMKAWSDAFFNGTFFESIRKEHRISMLSEREYLDANREKLIKSGCKEVDTIPAEPFDFSKITVNKIVDTKTAIAE